MSETETKEAKIDVWSHQAAGNDGRDNDVAPGEIRDIGADLYAEVDQLTPEELEEEGVRVRKILDRRIMPIVCLLFFILLCGI